MKIEQVVGDIRAIIQNANVLNPAVRTNPDFIVYQDIKPNLSAFLQEVYNEAIAQSSAPAV